MFKPGFNMSEAELISLVEEVKTDLQNIAKNEADKGTRLAKSDEGEEKPEASAAPSEGGSAPAPSAESAPPPAPAADPSAPPSEPPPGDPSAGAPPPGAEAGAGAGPSFEELVTLYTQLPPEDFEAHAAALQQAAQMRGGAGGPGAGAGAPPPPAGGPPGPGPSAPPPGPGPSAPAFKSEAKVKELEGTITEMQKSMAQMTQVIEGIGKVVTAPQRKAVTGITFVPMRKAEETTKTKGKPFESMSRVELHNALTEMTAGSGLKKSERDLISGFYQGSVRREALADLFKETK